MLTLTPAYGRDYKTAKDAKASWSRGDDWIIADMFHPYSGKPTSVRDGHRAVMLRFNGLRKTTTL